MFTISSWVCGRGFGRSASLQILAIATAMSVVCALQPIPNRIPHTFIRDHEHVLKKELLPLDFIGFQIDCYLKPLKHQR